jgi:hypothetical protein
VEHQGQREPKKKKLLFDEKKVFFRKVDYSLRSVANEKIQKNYSV